MSFCSRTVYFQISIDCFETFLQWKICLVRYKIGVKKVVKFVE